MPTVLQGDPSNVTTPLTATITALADNGAGAARATTSAPHLFGQGDTVQIATGALTGTFTIAVIDATHFDLLGSVFTATSTGTATDQSLTPAVQVPLDGDSASLQGSGMLSFQQAVMDRTAFNRSSLLALSLAAAVSVAITLTQNTGIPAPTTIIGEVTQGPPCKLHATGHGLQTGMTVSITGATGDASINGIWQVVVTDSNHFTIPTQAAGGYTANSASVMWVVPAGVEWVIVDGWGGGGGGEGGGGIANLQSLTLGIFGPYVQGGGGQGAPRITSLMTVVPLTPIVVVIGQGGAGGTASSPMGSQPAGAGASGGASTVTIGASEISCIEGVGAGAGQFLNNNAQPVFQSAVIAPGASERNDGGGPLGNRPLPFNTNAAANGGQLGYQYGNAAFVSGGYTNIANFINQFFGSGGAAVLVYDTATLSFNPSTGGVGNGGIFNGGSAGTTGTHGASGGNTYLGGPGGGGGGAGPGGPGGQGGAGSNGVGSGSSATAGSASGSFSGSSGAGGGGGGTAGAGPSGPGTGGLGAGGDAGQVTIYFVRAANG